MMHALEIRRARGGFVLVLVLFVLLALFALTAPFLATARNADAASDFETNDVQLRLALDGAARHARYELASTHPAVDETPYFDGLDELAVETNFPPELLDHADPGGVAWDAEATDLSGRIDLNSAPPQVFANLLGAVSRLARPVTPDQMKLEVNSADPFETGYAVSLNGELIRLGELDEDTPRALVVDERGLGTIQDDEGRWQTTGPVPPSSHGVGSFVFDQQVFAPAIWRTLDQSGELQQIDTLEGIRASDPFSMSGVFDDEALVALRRTTTPHASIGAGPMWQRSTRLIAEIEGGVSVDLRADEGRWMVAGSTIRVTDGINTELRVVIGRAPDGRVRIDRVFDYDYEAFLTEISVLAKRPVNINTASPEVLVALTTNLSLVGQNHRIDAQEARALAAVIVQSRPFTCFQDFAERVVFPGGGIDRLPDDAPVLPAAFENDGRLFDDVRDAIALYRNALNANDANLGFATMPFSFTTRGVFELELRANVSAESGIARTSGVRERIELVVPQRAELLQVFGRQEDFDDALRLTREAPYWVTGPATTARYDAGVEPPSRLTPHLGTLNGQRYIPGIDEPVFGADGAPVPADRVFASREDLAFLQLAPVRFGGTERTDGRILHFDQESRTLEGRFLPDEPIQLASGSEIVRWTERDATVVVEPLTLSMWVRPEAGGDGTLMAIGERTQDADRIVLGMAGGNLVLRVLDGMGDHRDTAFQEVAEARFPLASGAGVPGLPTGVWSHIDIDVRGNRPDQIGLLVNGNATGVERLGMTRLTIGITSGTASIPVESTEGFPDVCVLRIGNELIEATVAGGTSFDVQHQVEGPLAGFGGRLARVPFDIEGSDAAVPADEAAGAVTGSYAAGTPVMNYGYSLPLTENVPSGQSNLPSDLGPFRVARVVGLDEDNTLVPIQVQGAFGPIDVGRGWTSLETGALTLSLADAPDADPAGQEVAAAFNATGGYAVLSGASGFTVAGLNLPAPNGDTIGGVEVIRYSGVVGNQLQVVERNVQLQRLANLGEGLAEVIGGPRSFIFDWTVPLIVGGQEVDGDLLLEASTFCFPISLNVPGATDLTFAQPAPDISEFAQITRLDDAEQTEWVRYDELDVANSQLVRSDPGVLAELHLLLNGGISFDATPPGGPGGPGGIGPGGPGGPGSGGPIGPGGNSSNSSRAPTPPPPARAPIRPAAALLGSDWDPFRGADPNADFPLSQSVASVLHFRGVLGTVSGTHPAGALILPVVEVTVPSIDSEHGRPGARDAVFVVDGDPTAIGLPITVHRAHYPAEQRLAYSFSSTPGVLMANAGGSGPRPQGGEPDGQPPSSFAVEDTCFLAFDGPVLVPTSPGVAGGAAGAVTDPRFLGRIVKFPSGELPRAGANVSIGIGAGGQQDFGPAAATVDEIIFGDARANPGWGGTAPGAHTAGGALILAARCGEGDQSFTVFSNSVRAADGTRIQQGSALANFPPDGGLVRIGEEIIAYDSYQDLSGVFNVAQSGRGMFGTLPQTHEITEAVHWLEAWEVTTLAAAIGPDDAVLPVVSTDGFPTEGTALVGQELIHWTQVFGGGLVMPRSSNEPGAMDGLGPGVFRGRFGTAPGSWPPGTPVVLFPARYWDRYAPRFDGPELSYFALRAEQPGGWWRGVTWDAEEASLGGAEVVVLQRVGDAPWDGDPEDSVQLTLMEEGQFDGDFVPIDLQADRVEWRIFARYAAGAFDPEFGLQHGWKQTPRFNYLGVTSTAPGRVVGSVER
ncbi:MAG: hypothetical protein AAGA20_09310 [Planctomycetota bacterium]